jgi:hypothetical protein
VTKLKTHFKAGTSNLWKDNFYLNVQKFSSYLADKEDCLHYKEQSYNANHGSYKHSLRDHTKRILHSLRGQNGEFLSVTVDGTSIYR